MRKLYRSVDKNNRVIVKNKSKKISGLRAIDSSLNRKQIPLCLKHHDDWHAGILTKSDLKDEWR
jgi:hypothetical protein